MSVLAKWFVESVDHRVLGPFPEGRIVSDLFSGKIKSAQRVRQGNGNWFAAAQVRAIFLQLRSHGWYVRDESGGDPFGPFTDHRMSQLLASGEVEQNAMVRRGTDGNWRPACSQMASSTLQVTRHGSLEDVGAKWTIEPVWHELVSITRGTDEDIRPMKDCATNELLRLDWDAGQDRVVVRDGNGVPLGELPPSAAQRVLGNARRGVMNVAILLSYREAPSNCSHDNSQAQIAIFYCPPGTTQMASHDYINQHLSCAD